MTWSRVKRWLSEHPAMTIAPLVPAGTLLVAIFNFTCYFAAFSGLPSAPPFLQNPEVLVTAFLLVAGLSALGMWAYWIGCLRARAGLPMERASRRALDGWLLTAAMTGLSSCLISGGLLPPENMLFTPIPPTVVACILGIVPLAVVLVSLALASRTARRKIARGQWEVTVPPEFGTPQTGDDEP